MTSHRSGGRTNAPIGFAAVGLGVACFVAGIAAAELLRSNAPAPARVVCACSLAPPLQDAGVVTDVATPRIVFDPASIELLPDASLRLTLPLGAGGGAP